MGRVTDSLPFITRPHNKPDHRHLRVPPAVVASVLVGATVLLIGMVVTEHRIPIVQAPLGFLYLTLVPGYLVLNLIGVRPQNTIEFLVYVVGVSLMTVMAIGLGLNFVLPRLGLTAPIRAPILAVTIGGLMVVLITVHYRQQPAAATIEFHPRTLTSPWFFGLLILPVLGIYGALLLHLYSNNIVLLILYGAIGIVPFLVVYDLIPARILPVALFLIAMSLLLQNTLTGQFLAWGDQPKEAAVVLSTMETGIWNPAAPGGGAPGTQFTMLRLVLLHPIYLLLTDLKLVWGFKLIHPILFAITPVALYHAYENYAPPKLAFLAAYFYVGLFSFYIVLSRNTRTATALLFLALVLLLITDRDLSPAPRRALMGLFGAGIVVSHYGVSYMVLLALVFAFPMVYGFTWFTRFRGQTSPATRIRNTSWSFIALYAAVIIAWYLYASPGGQAFNLLPSMANHVVRSLFEGFLVAPEEASSTVRYLGTDWQSITLETLKWYNGAVALIVALGLFVTYHRLYRGRDTPVDAEYLMYATVFMGVFSLTFLPIDRFNTARTYATTLMVFIPFFFVGLITAFEQLEYRLRIPVSARAILTVGAAVVVVYFLLNSGFVAATVTHEYAPNALVEKDRIMHDGQPIERNYFYKQYPMEMDVRATTWLRTNAEPGARVHQSTWPGQLQGPAGHPAWQAAIRDQAVPLNTTTIRRGHRITEGYVYLGSYSYRSNTVTVAVPGRGSAGSRLVPTTEIESQWAHKHKLYDNGYSAIYG